MIIVRVWPSYLVGAISNTIPRMVVLRLLRRRQLRQASDLLLLFFCLLCCCFWFGCFSSTAGASFGAGSFRVSSSSSAGEDFDPGSGIAASSPIFVLVLWIRSRACSSVNFVVESTLYSARSVDFLTGSEFSFVYSFDHSFKVRRVFFILSVRISFRTANNSFAILSSMLLTGASSFSLAVEVAFLLFFHFVYFSDCFLWFFDLYSFC